MTSETPSLRSASLSARGETFWLSLRFGAEGGIRLELHGADAPFQLSAKNDGGEEVCIVAQPYRL